jgi:hypothetical protein
MLSYKVISNCLTGAGNSSDKTGDHMSRLLAAATTLFVAAGSWSVAAQQSSRAGTLPGAKSVVPRVAGARSDVLTIIQGNALDSANGPLPRTLMRLRDARFGRVIETQLTDKSGMFAFIVVDPGSYIVELLGQDRTVLAASQILTVNAGDTVSAVVKLPLRMTPFVGLLNSSIAPAAAMMATLAAASGIAAVVPTAPVSPNR